MTDSTIGLLLVAASLFAYLLPSFIAASRNHQNGCAIFVLNIILGWSLIGWCIALVWSCTNTNRKA